MPDFEYDLFVIGSGPAGQRAAIQAAKLGMGVHIIGEGASELIHIGQAVLTFGGRSTTS